MHFFRKNFGLFSDAFVVYLPALIAIDSATSPLLSLCDAIYYGLTRWERGHFFFERIRSLLPRTPGGESIIVLDRKSSAFSLKKKHLGGGEMGQKK